MQRRLKKLVESVFKTKVYRDHLAPWTRVVPGLWFFGFFLMRVILLLGLDPPADGGGGNRSPEQNHH